MSTRAAASLLSFLLLGCGESEPTGSASGSSDAGTSAAPLKAALDITLPKVEGWELLPRMDQGGGDGYRLGYSAPRGAVTVFVYDRGLAVIPEGAASTEIGQELETTILRIQQMLSMGEYQSVEEVVRDVVHVGDTDNGVEAMRSRVDIVTSSGHELRSFVYLTALRGHFVKIRTSSNGLSEEQEVAAIGPILKAVGGVLADARAE